MRFRGLLRPNVDLLALVVLLVAVNAPRFDRTFLPLNDSMQVFQIFHYIYSGLVIDGRLPEWIPYTAYGVPSDLWSLICMSPASWLSVVAGWALGVRDALLLFKISLLIEQLFFLLGTHLLSRELYTRRMTLLIVGIGAVSTLHWSTQIWWDFRIYYLLPLGLYFLVRFFSRGQAPCLWLAGLVFVFSLFGNLPYFAPIYLFIVFVVAAVFTLKEPGAWSCLRRLSNAHAAGIIAFVLVASAYVWLAQGAREGLVNVGGGRDPRTGLTSVSDFLTYGNRPDIATFLRLVWVGWPLQGRWSCCPDQTLYIGLLPLLLAGWAVGRVRKAAFLAVLSAMVGLLWLSLGGAFARVVYLFPTMSLFRHLGLLYGLVKFLMILCAGFGLDDALEKARGRHWTCAALLVLFVTDGMEGYPYLSALGTGGEELWRRLFGARVLAYALTFLGIACVEPLVRRLHPAASREKPPQHPARSLGLALMGVYLFDLLSFQYQFNHYQLRVPPSLAMGLDAAVTTEGFPYQPTRSDAPSGERARSVGDLLAWVRDQAPARNSPNALFLRFDPCWKAYWKTYFVPLMLKDVQTLVEAGLDNPAFAQITGCGAPKVRLVVGAALAANPRRARKWLQSQRMAQRQVLLLRSSMGEARTSAVGRKRQGPLGGARVVDFGPDHAVVDVKLDGADAAWLVYADAYHPGWKATLNGRTVPIREAYLAFKAIRVERGRSVVRFEFRPGFLPTGNRLTAGFGACLSALLLVWLAVLVARSPASGPDSA